MVDVVETEETLKRFDPPGGQLVARLDPSKPLHKLSSAFSFWFVKRVHGPRTQENYERNIKRIATVDSVSLFFFSFFFFFFLFFLLHAAQIEGFWSVYNHLVRPNDLSNANDYHLFRAGIKPMWEDPANKRGGKFTVRLRKGFASRYWEDLLLAVVGEQFGVGNELCGIGVSLRYNEDILSVWNATADDHLAKKQIYAALSVVMPLVTAANAAVDYKAHDSALQTAAQRRRQQRVLQKKAGTAAATGVAGAPPAALNKSAPNLAPGDELLDDGELDDLNDDDDGELDDASNEDERAV